jgi:hypothetical protein
LNIYIFFSLILVLGGGIFSLNNNNIYSQEPQNFEEYNSDLLDVTLQYPLEWKNVITEEELTLGEEGNRISFDLPFTKEGVFVILEKETEFDKLNEVELENLRQTIDIASSGVGEYDIIEVVPTTLDNHNATKLRFDNQYSVEKNSILQIVSLVDGKEYLITYRTDSGSFNKYLPTIENMIKSIKITED